MGEISYKTVGGRNFMLIPCEERGKNIETQIKILASGEVEGVLSITPTSKNGVPILQYDITGLAKLDMILQRGRLGQKPFSRLLEGLLSCIGECEAYTLSANGLSLDNGLIYFDTKQNTTKFTYIPTIQERETVEYIREWLRSLIAYGKVEQGPLTAAISDAINSDYFSILNLRNLVNKYGERKRKEGKNSTSSPIPHRENYRQEEYPHAESYPRPDQPAYVPPSPHLPPSPPPVTPAAAMSAADVKTDTKKKKNTIVIAISIAISVLLAIGLCLTPIIRTSKGGFDVAKILGIIILIGAVDLLILHKMLKKDPANEKPSKQATVSMQAAQHSPGYYPLPRNQAPAPIPTPVPTQKRKEEASVEELEDTVLFGAPVASGEWYLETLDGKMIPLKKSPFLLGREQSSDFRLTAMEVGRRHAEFHQRNNGWVIIDQNSTNHTYLNDQCLAPYTEYSLSADDTIQIASVTLKVRNK